MTQIIYADVLNVRGRAPKGFFFPIDSIYGEFTLRDKAISSSVKKEIWYLKNKGGLTINLKEELKSAQNQKLIVFYIYKDSIKYSDILPFRELSLLYSLGIKFIANLEDLEIPNSPQPIQIIVADIDKIRQNKNFKSDNPIYLRLGRYSENRYVIFFHSTSESNGPGRIPSE